MKYLYDISSAECVGDSLGKINYNFLSLDNGICQLSSLFFFDQYNLYTQLTELSAKMSNLNIIGKAFEIGSIYKETYTAVNLLSSYWSKREITIQYPVNVLQDVNDGVKRYYVDSSNTKESDIVNVALNYLNSNFPAKAYLSNFIFNVCFLMYSNDGNFTRTETGPYQMYPISQYWTVSFVKDDVYVKRSKTIKFKNISNTWIYIGSS